MPLDELDIPWDVHSERTVLAAMLYSDEARALVAARLDEASFYLDAHEAVFRAIVALSDEGRTVAATSLADRLRAQGDFDRVGGYAGLLEITNDPLGWVGWRGAVDVVAEKAARRALVYACEEVMRLACDPEQGVAGMCREAVRKVAEATESVVADAWRPLDELVEAAERNLLDLAEHGGQLGTTSGCPSLDAMTHGWRDGQLIVVGARTGVGKTTFALHMARSAAAAGRHAMFFSMEMGGEELCEKILLEEACASMWRAGDARPCLPVDRQRLGSAAERLRALGIDVCDAAELSVQAIRAYALDAMARSEARPIIFVDYLQLLSPGAHRHGETRATEVGRVTRGLKLLAMRLGCPVIATAQLNRASSSRVDRRPRLEDLRESGTIEQDADVVLLLDRALTARGALRDGHPGPGTLVVEVAKNRAGRTGTVRLACGPGMAPRADGADAR